MVNRSGFSFVAMMVINPIVILFYQNCSFAPLSHAAKDPAPIQREMASAGPAIVLDMKSQDSVHAAAKSCLNNRKACLSSVVE